MNALELLAQVLSKIPLSYLDTDGTLAANSDTHIATQKATKTYVDAATSGALNAWTTYTPTVTPLTGAITAYTASGRYLKVGKTLHVSLNVQITNNGTGAGSLNVSLPAALTSASPQVIGGRENQATGNGLTGTVGTGGSTFNVLTYNNQYPGGTNYTLYLTGVLEVN